MSLYIPKMSDTPGVTIPGLASNFNALADSRIVEQGSNENGEYIRWANGIQICTLFQIISLVSTVPVDSPYTGEHLPTDSGIVDGGYGSLRWYFPAGFAYPPAISVSAGGRHVTALTALSTRVEDLANTTVRYDFYVWNQGRGYTSGASYELRVSLFAFGRWE